MRLSSLPQETSSVEEATHKATETATAWVAKGQELLIAYGPKILAALAVFLIGKWIAGMLVGVVRKLMTRRQIDDTLTKFVCSLTRMALMVLVTISALQTMGVETTSFVAVLGAATLAIGFALQGSLSNFAAGVMIILFRPFKTGDYVEAAGTAGTIEEVGVFATVLRTPDNKKIIVPNDGITSGNIINYSAKDTRRIDLVFGIGYDDDIKRAKELLEEIVASEERILAEPAPTIAVSELADSSVNFVCRPWVKTPDYWAVRFDLTETVKLKFDEAGVSIPFPQRDVHVHQVAS